MNLTQMNTCSCPTCGKAHVSDIRSILTGKHALRALPEELEALGTKKVFVLTDKNAQRAAGTEVLSLLEQAAIPYKSLIFEEERLEPDEAAVGSAVMHYDNSCDTVVAVGSGVINDIGKILAHTAHTHYVIVATAPSMDGYASASSSMSLDGLKVSLPSRCADVIIGDTDILKNAPLHMLKAGLGDMLAKYVSICEWRISHLITGEYYCESIAQLVRDALKKCTDNADRLLMRDETAVEAVFEGLIKCGVAMSYAGLSRPASGMEHYFSHLWDMRGMEYGTAVDLHGIQCAVATLLSVRLYNLLPSDAPDKEQALCAAAAFDFSQWSKELTAFLGKGAEAMIAQEKKEGKYDTDRHQARLDVILDRWDDILAIVKDELPTEDALQKLFATLALPTDCRDIGIDPRTLPMTFMATKDIRDKYILSRLAWDLGLLEQLADNL